MPTINSQDTPSLGKLTAADLPWGRPGSGCTSDVVPSLDAGCPAPEHNPLPLDLPTLAVAVVIVAAIVLVSHYFPWGFGLAL